MRTILEAKDIAPLTAEQHRHIETISHLFTQREQAYAPPENEEGFKAFFDLDRRVDELVLSATRGQAAALSPSPLALRPVHHFIANLRSTGTDTYQFRNLVDQSYRLLFDHTDIGLSNGVIDTPVNNPAQQRALYMHHRRSMHRSCPSRRLTLSNHHRRQGRTSHWKNTKLRPLPHQSKPWQKR